MKFKGIKLEPPKPVPCVIPVGEVEVVFMVAPIYGAEGFNEVAPRPMPKIKTMADGTQETESGDKSYLDKLTQWIKNSQVWMELKALESSPDLEWEKVNINDPSTYEFFEKELRESGISKSAIEHLRLKIYEVSGMRQDLIEEATERFLAGQAQGQ